MNNFIYHLRFIFLNLILCLDVRYKIPKHPCGYEVEAHYANHTVGVHVEWLLYE